MGDARRQFTERREFLAHDDLILRFLQIAERAFEFFVLALDFLGQFFHQVQTLHLQGVATEDLERCGHFRDFVLSADIDFLLQIAIGHPAHAVRKLPEPTRKYAADEQPADQHGADETDGAQSEQDVAAGADGLGGILGGLFALLRAVLTSVSVAARIFASRDS